MLGILEMIEEVPRKVRCTAFGLSYPVGFSVYRAQLYDL